MLTENLGFTISIEGPEGAGKTVQIQEISNYLTSKGVDHIITREPGGIDIAEKIRHIILDPNNTQMCGRTEALLYASARRQHLVEKVFPALEAGKVVIMDRFIDSSLAYQGHARGIGIDEVYEINKFALGDFMPEMTLFFDITPERGMERINANANREVNRLDLEKMDFHHKVYEGYQILKAKFPERIISVNADQSIEAVTADVIKVLDEKLNI